MVELDFQKCNVHYYVELRNMLRDVKIYQHDVMCVW